ncbi:uncharacterized protein [Montipora capricornis]|uniref:uncharacterized protein isoform X3 n=1 Tax=Montipora capricornis TaxID=246305 RepID=UPI0035F10D8E
MRGLHRTTAAILLFAVTLSLGGTRSDKADVLTVLLEDTVIESPFEEKIENHTPFLEENEDAFSLAASRLPLLPTRSSSVIVPTVSIAIQNITPTLSSVNVSNASLATLNPTPALPPECYNYAVLNESNRATTYQRFQFFCDSRLSGWYRFHGEAGSRMPQSCVPSRRCGTSQPGWLNGNHPSVAEGAVRRRVCFRASFSCCWRSTFIYVRNCGAFFVYKLHRTPGCNLRYCGNGITPTTGATITSRHTLLPTKASSSVNVSNASLATLTPTPALPPECYNYAVLNESNRATTYQRFQFFCDSRLSGWYRFHGEAGSRMPQSCVPSRRCGTSQPGWLNGNHPSVAEGAVRRRVCFRASFSCCWRSTFIYVRNCGAFFVYKLHRTPGCNLRYCGNGITPTTGATITSRHTLLPTKASSSVNVSNASLATLTPTPALPPECYNYAVLNESNRATTYQRFQFFCDSRLSGWYRFHGEAGSRMPQSCVPSRRCGTSQPGWLNGNHPSVAEGAVRRRVCFRASFSCCWRSTFIYVRNCGAFFVYKLHRTPGCNLRYCGNGITPTTGATITSRHTLLPTKASSSVNVSNASLATLTPTPALPPECYNYAVLNESNRATTYQRFQFFCDSRLSGWYRFHGEAGSRMPQSCVPSRRCGTSQPGWLNGNHPSVAEGAVRRRVCFRASFSCCWRSTFIYVRNCGAFFVYKLHRTPGCNLRYCGNGITPTTGATITSRHTLLPTKASSSVNVSNASLAATPSSSPVNVSNASLATLTPTPALPPECYNYEVLNESSRATTYQGFTFLCDFGLSGWYRFHGEAGNRMPQSCVPSRRCGTTEPGWLNGSHPSVAEGAVRRQVCFSGSFSCCRRSTFIYVRNCGAFFVYRLDRTPGCFLRYCGNGIPPTTPVNVSNASLATLTPTPALPPECYNYEVLNESSRATTYQGFTFLCDFGLSGWYRFHGEAGNRMPQSCVPSRRCGTTEPGWLNGSHPSVAEGAVRRQVCFSGSFSCCRRSTFIYVRNCGAFFVYRLDRTPGCSLRYCGNGIPPTTPVNVSNASLATLTPTPALPPECYNYEVLNESNRAITYQGFTFLCDFRLSGWYRFRGEAGTRMPQSCVPSRRCGTSQPGWLNGSHPSVAEGAVRRQVCFSDSFSCCRRSTFIYVRNCGAFFVYKLHRTPGCFLRYCGNGIPPTTPVNVSNASLAATPSSSPVNVSNASLATLTPTPALPPECYNYEVLNESSRATTYQGFTFLCDFGLSGWYRFHGEAGNRMPQSCVPSRRCGTTEPGWLNGSHPSVAEGAVRRQVCFSGSFSCCRRSTFIYVRNCGAFFVYRLDRTPGCSLRYCGNGIPPTTPVNVSNASLATLTPTPALPPECYNYEVLNESNRAITYQGFTFLCDFRLSGWYRFRGEAGTRMPQSCVPSRRCGTSQPGWLNGSHPSVAEGAVRRQVCFSDSFSCCRRSTFIYVRNCGAFFVYKLHRTPGCFLRYCGNGIPPTTPVNVSNASLAATPSSSPVNVSNASLATLTPTPALPPECYNYEVLNESNRAITYQGFTFLCDFRLSGWYRFRGEAGTRMPQSCVPSRRCGTSQPGWLNGSHPSVSEGAVYRQVCFSNSFSCCRRSTFIYVRNCGAFFVYNFHRTPGCSLRYCGNGIPPTTPVNVSNASLAATPSSSPVNVSNASLATLTPTPALPPECYNYEILNESSRATTFQGFTFLCDFGLFGWYRFHGEAGSRMPQSCIPSRRCGTTEPGWLNGNHPSVAEGAVQRRVCFSGLFSCCRRSTFIYVRNCGAFFVYRLNRTPGCNLRYCGNGIPPTTPVNVSNASLAATPSSSPVNVSNASLATLTPTPALPPECYNYEVLNESNRAITYQGFTFLCDFRLSGWYRFRGEAGSRMPQSCVPSRRCGTSQPGWLNGSHPSVAEGAVRRQVCFSDSFSCCRRSTFIYIRNCGAFFVYKLHRTPGCFLRYCGNGIPPTTPANVSNASLVATPSSSPASRHTPIPTLFSTFECYNYMILNESDRALGNQSSNVQKCDRFLTRGWYRFQDEAGTKMPDNCVPRYSCGTHAPGYLIGGHPSVAQGIVNRTVCFHWVGGCCQWQQNILVRNCSGFYVYRLSPTRFCNLRYCGDSNSASTTSRPASTRPLTRTPKLTPTPTSSSGADQGFLFLCLPNTMLVKIPRDRLPSQADPSLLHLNDPECGAQHFDERNFVLRTSLKGCGTVRRFTGGKASFHNNVVMHSVNKRSVLRFPFKCSYNKFGLPGEGSRGK